MPGQSFVSKPPPFCIVARAVAIQFGASGVRGSSMTPITGELTRVMLLEKPLKLMMNVDDARSNRKEC